VESINIYSGGSVGSRAEEPGSIPRLKWAKDYGLEFLIHIGDVGPATTAQRRRDAARDRRRERALDSLRIVRTTRLETAGRLSAATRDSINRRFAADSARIASEPELEDAQMYLTDGNATSLFTMSSTSFEFGAPLGIDFHVAGDLHVTAEVAYMRRIFNSLSFDPPSGFPPSFPRALDLSGMSWSMGVQVPLP